MTTDHRDHDFRTFDADCDVIRANKRDRSPVRIVTDNAIRRIAAKENARGFRQSERDLLAATGHDSLEALGADLAELAAYRAAGAAE